MAAGAAWEVLEKIANLAQVISVLVTVFTSLLRVYHSNKRECAELERCIGRLRALLQWPWPATGSGAALALLCSEMGGPVIMALGDAARLVDSYKEITLWGRLRSGGKMAVQLRDMRDIIDSYCGLLLFVNAHILLQHHHQPIPASSDTTDNHVVNDASQSPGAEAVGGTQRAKDIGQGGTDNDPAGCETNMPDLLPIVISHA